MKQLNIQEQQKVSSSPNIPKLRKFLLERFDIITDYFHLPQPIKIADPNEKYIAMLYNFFHFILFRKIYKYKFNQNKSSFLKQISKF